jgi:hypothetical protein
MSNKKRLNFLSEVSYLRSKLSKENQKYFDVASKLYTEAKIEKKNSMWNIIFGLMSGEQVKRAKAISAIKKFREMKPVIGIKEKGSVYNEARHPKNFHIQANITLRTKYNTENKHKYEKVVTESRIVKAYTLSEAKAEYEDDLNYLYNNQDSYYITNVKDIDFVSVLPVKTSAMAAETIHHMRMRQASQHMDYNDVKEYKGFLDTSKDMCVINNIVGYLANDKFSVTEKKFIEDCKYYYSTVDTIEYSKSDLDFGLSNDWSPEDGVSPACLQWWCEKYDVSHYAFDVSNFCFSKHVAKNRNKKSLCYFCINNHMYLVTDREMKESMTKRAYDVSAKLNSALFEENFERTNIFTSLVIHENIEVSKVTDFKESCIFMYSGKEYTNITNVMYDVISIYNVVPSSKNILSVNHNITRFSVTINDVEYFFVLDPNDSIPLDTNDLSKGFITYKTIRQLCDDNKIEFKNQSFVTMVNQLKDAFFKSKREVSDEKKAELILKAESRCKHCGDVSKEFHIDHIRPLSNGGTNDDENLQVLCVSCHKDKCETEIENGMYTMLKDTQSSFNNQVTEVMKSQLARSYAFVEKLVPEEVQQKVYNIDINKCRKNILYYGAYDFPVFTVMDSVEKYTGQSGAGYYYIESNNYIPLHGNGWYVFPVVDFCLKNNIITSDQIKFTVQASLSVPGSYFNEFIDYCYTAFGSLAKLSINGMIGCFNINIHRNTITKTIGIVKKSFDCYSHYFMNFNTSRFVNALTINDDTYYHMFEDIERTNMETESPIYNQIVQIENVMINEMMQMIQNAGGKVLDLNTDCCSCVFPNDVFPFTVDSNNNIVGQYFDGYQLVPKYKLETKDRLSIERCRQSLRCDTFELAVENWKVSNDNEGNDFSQYVSQIVGSNESWNIDGPAGAGKSFLIKSIQQELKSKDKKYVTLCPTNISALVIPDGQTLHKFRNTMKKQTYIKNNNIEYIFVDEISMVHEMFYKFLLLIKKLNPQTKLIVSGDFQQLLPVNDRYTKGNYADSQALFELCDGNRFVMTKCRRADDSLFNICKAIKNDEEVDASDLGTKFYKTNLCFTNKKRIAINRTLMDFNVEKYGKRGLVLPKRDFNDNSQAVNLFKNTPIISMKNNTKLNIVNNEQFTIDKIDSHTIYFSNDMKKGLTIPIDQFQRTFFVAYAMTIHKSQGATFTKPYTIHEWNHPRMDKRLKYVALSRATSKDLINIMV